MVRGLPFPCQPQRTVIPTIASRNHSSAIEGVLNPLEMAVRTIDKRQLAKPYQWLIVAIGAATLLSSTFRFSFSHLDLRFLILALVTICLGSRITIQIPRV